LTTDQLRKKVEALSAKSGPERIEAASGLLVEAAQNSPAEVTEVASEMFNKELYFSEGVYNP